MKKEGLYDIITIILFLIGSYFLANSNAVFGFGLWIIVLLAVLFKRQIL